MKLAAKLGTACLALLAVGGCYPKGSLEGSQVETVKVNGRRFEVRVAPTGNPNEWRMLIVRATLVINPDPEVEMERAREVADRYEKQTCKGGPYEEILAGLQGEVNYRVLFRCK
ncbi:MAG TPA: hypothetical protein VFB13_19350 [Reyranella sp.]|jgi:hypothetical protein|nr:hypothetical protein [Reyranella sp.]